MIRIGYASVDYGLQRNVLNPETFPKKKVWGYNALLNFVLGKINKILKARWISRMGYPDLSFRFFGGICLEGSYDVIHLWNGISFCRGDWIVTHEHIVPRSTHAHFHSKIPASFVVRCDEFKSKYVLGMKQLARDNCRRIIALSGWAYGEQKKFLEMFPEYAEKILAKMEVLHPPQKIICDDLSRFDDMEEIRFIFVGGSFWRKGGIESFNVLRKLRREGFAVRLTLVSSLQTGDYAMRMVSAEEREAVRTEILAESEWCEYHNRLPNEEALKRMTEAHVMLLPTHADTYGYSVLEGQACGCACITTNVNALPEINNEETGWVVEVERDEHGNSHFKTDEECRRLEADIERKLEAIVRGIFEDKGQLKRKAAGSIRNIRERHDPKAHAERLKEIYLEGAERIMNLNKLERFPL